MISGISSSLAALFTFGKKLSITAENVANSNTDGYKKTTATITENSLGLPDITVTKDNTPGSLYQAQGTLIETSNVDYTEEFPQMMLAQRGYEANINALKAQTDIEKTLMDILA